MTLLKGENLFVCYTRTNSHGKSRYILRGVSFELEEGDILGVIGASGSGKSTLIRAVAKLIPVDRGRLWLDGRDYTDCGEHEMRPFRSQIQSTFQDAAGSFDPRWLIGAAIAEPLRWLSEPLPPSEVSRRLRKVTELVGLEQNTLTRSVRSLSGGQVRRAALARALIVKPRILLLDEPFAGLDLPAQVELLQDLAQMFKLLRQSVIIVTHDLAHVRALSSQLMVIENGRIIEQGSTASVVRSGALKGILE